MDFKCLPVKVLCNIAYYDGPLSGLCQYEDKIFFFWMKEEIMFPFPETDPTVLALSEGDDFDRDYHRLRIFGLYDLPQEHIDAMIFNNKLFNELKVCGRETWGKEYNDGCKKLPEFFSDWKKFMEVGWEWAVGYTTEDVWDTREYYHDRYNH